MDISPLLAVALVACGGGGGGGGSSSDSTTTPTTTPTTPTSTPSTPTRTPTPTPTPPTPPPPMDMAGSFDVMGSGTMVSFAYADPDNPRSASYSVSVDGMEVSSGASASYTIPQSHYGKRLDVAVTYTDDFGTQTQMDFYIHRVVTGTPSGLGAPANVLPDQFKDFQSLGLLFDDDGTNDDDVIIVVIDNTGSFASGLHGSRVVNEAEAFLPQDAEVISVEGDPDAINDLGIYLPLSGASSIEVINSELSQLGTARSYIFVISTTTVPQGLLDVYPNSLVVFAAGNLNQDNPISVMASGARIELASQDQDRQVFAIGDGGTASDGIHASSNHAGDFADLSLSGPYISPAGDPGPGTSFTAPYIADQLALMYQALNPLYGISLETTLAIAKHLADRGSSPAEDVGHGSIDLRDILHKDSSGNVIRDGTTTFLDTSAIEDAFAAIGEAVPSIIL